MTKFLMIALILTFCFTCYIIIFHREKPQKGELFRVKEIFMTLILGIALWVETIAVLFVMYTTPDKLVNSGDSTMNIYIFLSASIILGAVLILYYSVKCIIISDNDIIYISIIGKKKTIAWKNIKEIKTSQGRRLTIIGKDGVKLTVGGNKESYKRFLKMSEQKIKPEIGEDIILGLKAAFKCN